MIGRIGRRQFAQRGALAAMFLCFCPAVPALEASAQVSTPTADGEQMYVDPGDRFAIPIPTNWIAEELDGYVRISTNDGKIEILAAMVEASGATAAIDQLLRSIEPEVDETLLELLLATPAADGEATAFYTLDDGAASGTLLQGLGRQIDDSYFVLVIRGDLETIKLRQVQVDKIFNGILIRTEAAGSPVATPSA